MKLLTISILILLLFLRFPYIFFVKYVFTSTKQETLNYFMFDATYVLSAFFIFLKRDCLYEYNITFDSLLLFTTIPIIRPLVYNFLTPLVPWKIPFHYSWIQIATSIGLIILIVAKRTSVKKLNSKHLLIWIFISILAGFIVGGAFGFTLGLNNKIRYIKASLAIFLYLFITQLNNAAIIEEPLFRGFLWGTLRKSKVKEITIFIIQLLLFWLAHIYYIVQSPFSFWVVVPVSACLLGVLVMKSKTLTTSTLAHGIINSFGNMVSGFKF